MESRLELTVSSRAAEQHINRLQRELERLDGRGSAATAMMGKMSLAVGAISAAAGGLGFSRIIRETASFEDAMLGLQAVSGATTKQMSALEKQARTLGATSMFSAEQAGNAQRYLAQAGFEVNEVLSATPGILQLATAAQMGLAEAADAASNILGGMRLEVDQLNRVNDVLAATAAGSNTSVSQLAQALSTAAPLAAAAGISIEETAAAIGVMSDAGIQAERAGTGLQGVIRQLSNVTPQATAALEGYGLSLEDVNVETNGLSDVLEILQQANISTADAFKIFGSEAGAAAQILVNGNGRVTEFTESLRDADGAAEEMSLIIGGGLTGSMKGFGSMLSETIIGLGRDDGLAAGFQSVTDTATGMLAVYNDMLPAFAEANKLSEAQTDRIEMLAAGVDMLGDAAIIAAGVYAGRFVAAMAAGTLSLANKTKASIASAQAEAAAAQAVTRRTGAEALAAKRLLGRAAAEARATQGTAAHTAALARLNTQRQLAIQASTAHTVATNASTAAMGRASVAARAMGTASRGAAGAMALMGGPLGLLVGAAGLLYVFRDELNLTGQRAGLTEDQISDLRDEMQDMSQDDLSDSLSTLNSALDTATLKAATAREELASLRSDLGRGEGGLAAFREVDARHELAAASNAVADAEQRIAELNDRINVARGETASRIEESANAYVVYADRVDEAGEATRLADEFTKTLSASTEDAAEKTYTLADAHESLLDRITPNRREARQYAQDLGVLNLALASGRMTTTQYMQAMGMLQESFQAAQRDSTDLSDTVTDGTDEMTREMERFGNSVDDVFVDAFKGAFDSFNDFADGLKNAFETLMAELAYAAVKNEIKIQLGMGTSGPSAGGLGSLFGGSGGGMGGIGSLINGGKSLLGMGGSSAGGLYAGAATQSAGTLYGSAATGSAIGTGAAGGGFLSSAASLAGPIAAMYGMASMGNKLFESIGAYDALGIETGGRSSEFLGQIAPIGGTIIGSALDALGIGGQETPFSGRFGTRSSTQGFEHQGNESSEGQFYRESALGTVGFFNQGTERLQRAGTGNKEWADELAAGAAQIDNLVASLAQSTPELTAMQSAVQGLETSSRSAAQIVEFALEERPRAALEALGGHFGEFVRGLEGGIESVVQQAQVAQQAHSVLASGMDRLNLQFDASAAGAYDVANGLAQYAGSVQNMAAINAAYYNAAFTETERLSNSQQDLLASLTSVTDEAPRTVTELRAIVEAQGLNSESSAQLAYDLMALAPALKETNAAVRGAIEQQYQDVLGRAPDASGMDYWFDQVASGAMSLEQALQRIANSAEAAADAALGVDLSLVRSAYESLQEAISAEQEILRSAHDQATASIRDNMSRVQDAMRTTERIAGSLQNTLDQMMGNGVIDQRGRFDAASGYLRQTLASGGLGDPDQLERALSVVSQPSEGMYSTLQDYQRDFLSTANIVDQLNDRADEQLTTEDRSLRALERQIDQADRQFDREMSALDRQLERQTDILEAEFGTQDWLSTVNDSVLSMAQAIAGIQVAAAGGSQGAINVAQGRDREGDPLVSGATGSIADAYRDILGRDPDDSGLDYYSGSGFSAEEVRKRLADSPEAKRYAETGMPGFKDGGIASGPTSGYPVELHGTEAVIPLKGGNVPVQMTGNARNMFDIGPLLKEVARLRADLRAQSQAFVIQQRETRKILKRWDGQGVPETRGF